MRTMTLYSCNYREKKNNAYYRNKRIINNFEDLQKVACWDHVMATLKNSHRSKEDFISVDGLIFEIDNTHSVNKEDWQTLDDLTDALPDVMGYYVQSRNYMKTKKKTLQDGTEIFQEPREKWHIYFPLANPIDDYQTAINLMYSTVALFPFFDMGAAKPVQPMFGVAQPKGGTIDGTYTLDEYLASDPDGLKDQMKERVKAFYDNVESGHYELTDDESIIGLKSIMSFVGLAPSRNAKQAEPAVAGSPDDDWIDDAEQQRAVNRFRSWAAQHKQELGREYRIDQASHPKAIVFCVPCPWESKHTEDTTDDSTVVIIDRSGKRNFVCRHGHCVDHDWKEYRAKVEHDNPVESTDLESAQGALADATRISKQADIKLKLNDKGHVKNVISNYTSIFENDPYWKGKFSWDLLSGRTMITGVYWHLDAHAITDVDISKIRRLLDDCYGISSKQNTEDAVISVAYDNKHHPVLEELNRLPAWDGVQRLGEFLPRYLGAERSDYTTAVTTLLFVGIVCRIRSPGCKFDLCIILADTKQGSGKSTICRFIALNDEWFTDGLTDLSDPKKSFEAICGHVVVELGEMLATRRAKDVEGIKAYLSKTADDYRLPYGHHPLRYQRQCVFIGTTNKPQFLPDDKTGNRRFIPVLCDGNKAEVHPLDNEQETRDYIRQCYAEAIQIVDSGNYSLTLDRRFDDYLNELQEASAPDDSRIGVIQEWLDNADEDTVCTRMIWEKALNQTTYTTTQPARYELQDIADIMNLKIAGWSKYVARGGRGSSDMYRFKLYGRQRAWIRNTPEEAVNSDVNTVSTGVNSNSTVLTNDTHDDDFLTDSDGEQFELDDIFF